MPVGSSNRIVVDIDIESKRLLYTALASENKTLKKWFIENVDRYLAERSQPSLFPFGTNTTEQSPPSEADTESEGDDK